MCATQQSKYSLRHLSNDDLECDLHAHAGRDRTTTADLLSHIAEYDRRKRYIPAGFSSMHVYCTTRLLFSGDMAYKRIRVARAARRFPGIYEAIADGRLNVSGVVLLAPKLMTVKWDEGRALLRAAVGKSRAQIEQLVAERYPQPDVPTALRVIPSNPPAPNAIEAHVMPEVGASADGSAVDSDTCLMQLAPGPVATAVPELSTAPASPPAISPAPPARIHPLSPQRFSLQLTMDQTTHDKLRRAQELLSHAIPNGDVAQVLDRALDALIAKLEKRKLGKTDKPRRAKQRTSNSRNIPAHVKRAVDERDQGQCTFVSDSGHRCGASRFLEYHHVEEVARGGEATVENIRMRCWVHNQYAAEQTFGEGFMEEKREAARRSAVMRGAAGT